MRRTFAIGLLLALTASSSALAQDADFSPPAVPSFPDVPASHANFAAIEYVKANGIVKGYADGTYGPGRNINRAEFTKIIIGALFSQAEINGCLSQHPLPFSDVSAGDWFAPYACVAFSHQIIGGYSDGTFKPTSDINFVEATKILAGSFQLSLNAAASNDPWYKPFVDALASKNAIPLSIVAFTKNVTRGEDAEMIYRLKAGVTTRESQSFELLNGDDKKAVPLTESAGTENFTQVTTNSSVDCAALTTDVDAAATKERGSYGTDTHASALAGLVIATSRYRKKCLTPSLIQAMGTSDLKNAYENGSASLCSLLEQFRLFYGKNADKDTSVINGTKWPKVEHAFSVHQEMFARGCFSLDTVLKAYEDAWNRNYPTPFSEESRQWYTFLFSAYVVAGNSGKEATLRADIAAFMTQHADYPYRYLGWYPPECVGSGPEMLPVCDGGIPL